MTEKKSPNLDRLLIIQTLHVREGQLEVSLGAAKKKWADLLSTKTAQISKILGNRTLTKAAKPAKLDELQSLHKEREELTQQKKVEIDKYKARLKRVREKKAEMIMSTGDQLSLMTGEVELAADVATELTEALDKQAEPDDEGKAEELSLAQKKLREQLARLAQITPV